MNLEEQKNLVVIPTFNNINTIKDIVARVAKTNIKFLVINDGSNDGTLELLKQLNINHINFENNRGKGAAIQAGLQWAEKNQFSHMITIDADGQHFPEDITKFIIEIKKHPKAIIIGNRNFKKNPNIPFSSKLGQKVSNLSLKLLTGISLVDTQTGFRAYPVHILSKLNCKTKGYEYELEVLIKGIRSGIQIIPVNILVHYSNATRRASHFKPFKDTFKIAKYLIRILFTTQ